MDRRPKKLMAKTFDKNMIDKDEYPATAAIEARCVNGRRPASTPKGFAMTTVQRHRRFNGQFSEAVMLAGLAMSWRWRDASARTGVPPTQYWYGLNVQVVWEKFCRYFDVEP